MGSLKVQLTIEKEPGREAARRLAPRRVLEIESLPCSEIEGRALGFELLQAENNVVLNPDKGVCVNGKEVTERVPLHICDVIKAGGYEYGFYLKRWRPPMRPLCRFLAWLAKGIACVCLAAELLVMCGLPFMLSQASAWDGSIMLQRIVRRIEELRGRVSKLDDDGAIKRAVAAELSLELNECARYVRAYDRRIRRGQRREIMHELERIDGIMKRLESKEPLGIDTIGEPDLNGAVKRTLGL